MRVVGTLLVALLLLAGGSALQSWLPGEHDDPASEPHVRTASVGETVDLRTTDLTVEEVVGSPRLLEFGAEKVSPGLWIVVTYTTVARTENTSISFVEAVDGRGRTWGMVGRSTNSCPDGPPGVPTRCVAVLEVPPDALPTLVLRLARESADIRYDVVAEVDLGLTEEDAEELGSREPIEVPSTGLGEEVPS